jgi:hypothetical protein
LCKLNYASYLDSEKNTQGLVNLVKSDKLSELRLFMKQRFPGVDGGASSGLGIDFGAHAFGGSNVEMTQAIEEKNFMSILGYIQT